MSAQNLNFIILAKMAVLSSKFCIFGQKDNFLTVQNFGGEVEATAPRLAPLPGHDITGHYHQHTITIEHHE